MVLKNWRSLSLAAALAAILFGSTACAPPPQTDDRNPRPRPSANASPIKKPARLVYRPLTEVTELGPFKFDFGKQTSDWVAASNSSHGFYLRRAGTDPTVYVYLQEVRPDQAAAEVGKQKLNEEMAPNTARKPLTSLSVPDAKQGKDVSRPIAKLNTRGRTITACVTTYYDGASKKVVQTKRTFAMVVQDRNRNGVVDPDGLLEVEADNDALVYEVLKALKAGS